MKKNSIKKCLTKALFVLFLFCFVAIALSVRAQTGTISGKVADTAGNPLVSATVKIRGTNKITRTSDHGEFIFQNLLTTDVALVVSYVGYTEKEIKILAGQNSVATITLEEKPAEAEEIIVTGVFDKRKKMEASVAITTLNEKQISTCKRGRHFKECAGCICELISW